MAILTKSQIEFISENQEVFNLVLNHQYLPNGFSLIVGELDKINQSIGGKKTQLGCGSCIVELFKEMNYHYKNQPAPVQDAKAKTNRKS